jgi:hypothetical protein
MNLVAFIYFYFKLFDLYPRGDNGKLDTLLTIESKTNGNVQNPKPRNGGELDAETET